MYWMYWIVFFVGIPLTIRGARALFGLGVKGVEGADGVVEQWPVNLSLQLSWESRGKLDPGTLRTKTSSLASDFSLYSNGLNKPGRNLAGRRPSCSWPERGWWSGCWPSQSATTSLRKCLCSFSHPTGFFYSCCNKYIFTNINFHRNSWKFYQVAGRGAFYR